MDILVGIDIGARLVKVVEIEHKGGGFELVNAFMFETPLEKKTRTVQSRSFFDQLFAVLPASLFRKASLGVNIASPLVTMITVSLPRMPKKELDIAAVAEARRKMLPTPSPDSIFYNSFLREIMVGKIPRFEVLVAKTEKNYINEVVNLFSSHPDILPSFINPTCYAIAGHYSRKSPVGAKETAFVDLGYESIDVSIAAEGKMRFYRNIKFGLKDIISHIALALGKESLDMEKVIRDKGVPEVELDLSDKVKVAEEIMRQKYEVAPGGLASDDVNSLELRMLWAGEIERIVHEIRRTLIYYKEQTGGDRVDVLQFLGGGSAIKGLIPAISKDLGGTNTVISAFEGISGGSSESLSQARQFQMLYAGAVSLALGPLVARKARGGLDFLPEELKRRRQVIQQQIGVIVFVIIIASAAFLVWLNFFIANRLVNMEISNTKREISHADNVVNQLQQLSSEKELIKKKSQKVIDIMDSRIDAVDLFRTVAQAIPAEVTLSTFSLEKTETERKNAGPVFRVRMQAFCVSDYQQAVNLAHDFKNSLEKTDTFTGVTLVMPELEKIKPVAGQEGDMILTETVKRTFSLEALIGPSPKTAAVRQGE
jgi:Tfp pilus assembly PilM family ATPase/Tfp pilus assembly protein PilN